MNNSLIEQVQVILHDEGYEIETERIVQYGYQIRTTTGTWITVYDTGTIQLQGTPDGKLKSLLKK